MAPDRSRKTSKQEFDVIQNRIALALAKRDSLIKTWTSSSSRVQTLSTKTEEELDAEDALHFRREPSYLGVGAPLPSEFLISDAQQQSQALRTKFFPTKGLKASKAREAEEKAASAKRGLKVESSDEEEGRSGLGKAKKLKIETKNGTPIAKEIKLQANGIVQGDKSSVKAKKKIHQSVNYTPKEDATLKTRESANGHHRRKGDGMNGCAGAKAEQSTPKWSDGAEMAKKNHPP